jgi:hypothetical protein
MINSQDFLTRGDGYSPNKETDAPKTTHNVCVDVPASSDDLSSVQESQGDLTASDYVSKLLRS